MLVDGEMGADDVALAARVVARYSKGRDAPEVDVAYTDRLGGERVLTVRPLPATDLPAEWVL